jgi:hypothetical protein
MFTCIPAKLLSKSNHWESRSKEYVECWSQYAAIDQRSKNQTFADKHTPSKLLYPNSIFGLQCILNPLTKLIQMGLGKPQNPSM